MESLELVEPGSTYTVAYQYTVKNIGDGPIDLNEMRVTVQAYVSNDTFFKNADDQAAGGQVLRGKESGLMQPGESLTGRFGAGAKILPGHRFLVLKVDYGETIKELDESNNTLAVSFAEKKARNDKAVILQTESSDWTNSDGRTIKAQALRVDGRNLILKLPKGGRVSYPVYDLSEESKEKLRELLK